MTARAIDESTYVVNCAFEDENGLPALPNAITWTLTNDAGVVINSRQDVVVAVPAASVDIVLAGQDLDYADGPARIMVIDATYDSSLGDDLPLRESIRFLIEDLVGTAALTLKGQMASDLSVFFDQDGFSDTVSYTPIGGVAVDINAIITRDEIFQEPYVRGPRLASAKLHVQKWEVSNPQFGDTYTFETYTWEMHPNQGVIYEDDNVFIVAVERRMV